MLPYSGINVRASYCNDNRIQSLSCQACDSSPLTAHYAADSLFHAWETAATRTRKLELVLEVADQLLNVDLKPLRRLPRSTKDPDHHHPVWTIIRRRLQNKPTRPCESGAGSTTPTESVNQTHDANGEV